MTSSSQARPVWRNKNVMDGRPGFQLQADWGRISVLAGGGHICELNLNACDGVNPLWRPQWATIDPFKYRGCETRAQVRASAGCQVTFRHCGISLRALEQVSADWITPSGKQAAIENHHEFTCHRYRVEQMQSGGICGDR